MSKASSHSTSREPYAAVARYQKSDSLCRGQPPVQSASQCDRRRERLWQVASAEGGVCRVGGQCRGRPQSHASFLPTKTLLQTRVAEKLVAVLRPESLGRLARRRQGRERCALRFGFDDPRLDIGYSFTTSSKSEVDIDHLPTAWVEKPPVFLPTRELLTIYPGFVSVYENHYLEFEETWRDTCLLLGAPALRGRTRTTDQGAACAT